MTLKKIAALGMAAMMTASMIPAVPAMAEESEGSVYYLQFKPEAAEQWVALGEKYTEETGVEVNIVTAASGTY